MDVKCIRSGKKIPERHYLIQTIVYLGKSSKRRDLCENCYQDFIDWIDELNGGEE